MRARSESALEAVTLEAAAYKDKLQEATAGQAEAARLAIDLDVERNLHKEAKSHVAALESRLVLPANRLHVITFAWVCIVAAVMCVPALHMSARL